MQTLVHVQNYGLVARNIKTVEEIELIHTGTDLRYSFNIAFVNNSKLVIEMIQNKRETFIEYEQRCCDIRTDLIEKLY